MKQGGRGETLNYRDKARATGSHIKDLGSGVRGNIKNYLTQDKRSTGNIKERI